MTAHEIPDIRLLVETHRFGPVLFQVGVDPEQLRLTMQRVGNSVGLVLPKEMLARLKVEKGDTVFVTESPDGYAITPYDPTLVEQLDAGREFMREFRDTFHELAK